MDSRSTRAASSQHPGSAPDAGKAASNLRSADAPATTPKDAPKRCFICLTDQEPSEPASTWVDPCPCTLEAHQDCMQSWIVDCERSEKPFRCPVCKFDIQLQGPWDPVVALSDAVQRKFTKASPAVLLTATALGVQTSLIGYGAVALWAFSGRDVLFRYLLGPGMVFDARRREGASFIMERVGSVLTLMNIAPVLLLSQLLPSLGNKTFVPAASFWSVYHILHDDHFLGWPPSPQLAMIVFPFVRSTYYNMWREFVFPYEVKLNRQLLGLPPVDTRPNGAGADDRRNGDRNAGEGGVIGFLQNLLDVLDPDDQEQGGQNFAADFRAAGDIRVVHEAGNAGDGREGRGDDGDGDVVVELVIEEVVEGDDQAAEVGNFGGNDGNGRDNEDEDEGADDADGDDEGDDHGEVPWDPLDVERQLPPEALAPQEEVVPEPDPHEAPPPPAAGRAGLGTILSNFSNAIVKALILPGVSFAMGEALRLVLPRPWTRDPGFHFGLGRPGLLQQQWGRSLVGGCLYVVVKDAMRLYTKQRKVAAMGQRRVKNVVRQRGGM